MQRELFFKRNHHADRIVMQGELSIGSIMSWRKVINRENCHAKIAVLQRESSCRKKSYAESKILHLLIPMKPKLYDRSLVTLFERAQQISASLLLKLKKSTHS
jgi:hypothetical protein